MGTIILPAARTEKVDLSRLHTLARDFFGDCASQKKVSQRDFDFYGSQFLMETVYALYGVEGIEFILKHQERHRENNDKPDNGSP